MNKECARLALWQGALTTTPSRIGVKDAGNTTFTWYVNMAQTLGETLWNNYKAYSVNVCQFSRLNNLSYSYLSGINIIQTSQMGQAQGDKALISAVVQPYATSGDSVVDCYSGLSNFIMIKPDNNIINLTYTFSPYPGYPATTSPYGALFFTFYGLKEYNPIYKNPVNRFYQCEHVNFSVSTNLLQAGSTNEYGTLASNFSSFSFTNLNMRNIIGKMWDKYDKFNIVLQSVGMGQPSSGTFSGDQKQTYIFIEGLQFINNMTMGFNNSIFNGRYGIFGVMQIETAATQIASGNVQDDQCAVNTFRKPETENITLTFTIGNVSTYPATTLTYANWNLSFSIFGVNDE